MLLGSAYGKVSLDSSGVVTGVQNAVNALKNFKSSMELLNGGLNKLKANFDTAKAAVAAARAELDKLKASGAAKQQIEAAAKSLKTLEANARTAGAALRSAEGQIQQLRQAGMQLGQTMQNVGNALTVGVTLPLIAAGGAAIKLASDLEETKSKVKMIFGEMSDEMLDWSETANTALGQTRQQALDAASTFALFGKVAGKSGDELNRFAQQNVQFAADFASFYNTSPEDAITAIGAAYRGESEPIRRFNILLNDQIIKEKALALRLYDGNGQLSQQARILAVNTLIMEQGNAAMGDFARTSGGLANQTRILQAQFKDSLALLGQNLLPIAVQVTKMLNVMLTAFQKLTPFQQQFILVMLGLAAALGPVLSTLGGLLMFVMQLIAIWPSLVAGAAMIGPAFAGIGAVITGTVIPALVAFVAAALPIIAAVALVAAAVGLLYWAWTSNFNGFRTTIEQMGFLIEYYSKKWWNDLVTGAKIGWTNFMNSVKRGVQNVINLFKIDWGALGRNIILGIAIGIIKNISAIVDAAKRSAQAALTAFKNALGIKSPSTKFEFAGKMSALGYIQGLGKGIDPATIAASIARPVQNISRSATQTNTYQFPNGMTLREGRKLADRAEEAAYRRTLKLMGVE
jgi:hypothetical protein